MPRTTVIDPRQAGLTISKSTGALGPGDPYWTNVKFMFSGQGTNGQTTFTDTSLNAVTINRGGSAILSNSPTAGKWGGTGLLLAKATNDRIFSSGNSVTGGTGDFAIECWVYINSYTTGGAFLFDPRSTDSQSVPTLYFDASGTITLFENGATQITGSVVSLNTWTHIALARTAATTKLYVAGTQQGSSYSDSNNWSTTTFYIGSYRTGGANPLDGLISDFRITIGTSRGYSGSSITVPTAAMPSY